MNNISDCLILNSINYPDKIAFIFLEDGENLERRITFLELNSKVNQLANRLIRERLAGKRVVLLYKDSIDFIISFLACQLSGVIAVPSFFSRGKKQISKILSLITDAQSNVILTTESVKEYLYTSGIIGSNEDLIQIISTNSLPQDNKDILYLSSTESEVAFLQYTSGSTSQPKGVIISPENLMNNLQSIKETFGCNEDSVIFSWLPFHHDMGLIGNILHSVYLGCTCILMSPYDFMQKPLKWLKAISRFKVTHSGGPNFAYDLCVSRVDEEDLRGLDLSSWKVAYCGSEPVRKDTLDRFCQRFGTAGFNANSFYPCYGLAEATLLVAGIRQGDRLNIVFVDTKSGEDGRILLANKGNVNAKPIVSSGRIVDKMSVKIISDDDLHICGELEEGEICIAGPNVSKGYWNKDNSPYFYEIEEGKYLRTGDTGFCYRGELFIHGRIKELLIFRGKNYYPNDIEQDVCMCDASIESNGVVVFNKEQQNEEFVVLVEVRRTHLKQLNPYNIISKINSVLVGILGAEPFDIMLISTYGIPRTTSGKLQRILAMEMYQKGNFSAISSKRQISGEFSSNYNNLTLINNVTDKGNYESIRKYLLNIIESKVGSNFMELDDKVELTDIGIDSLRSMELINTINKDLNISVDAAKMHYNNTLFDLINFIENVIWLKKTKPSGKEIII